MDRNYIHKAAANLREKLIKWRRNFHQNPELELDCSRTAAIVTEELISLGFNVKTGYAKTGIVANIGSGSPIVAMRVDMDALPIDEETGLPFASKIKGVMHACGHDGHAVIGLGVAHVISSIVKNMPGKLILIFQPGEEYPGGASIMIEEGAFQEEKPDFILGMHIFPEIASGKIGIRYGVMTASDNEFTIKVIGQGGHGAYPHKAIDPFPATAALINAIQTIVSRNIPPLDSIVISLGEIKGGASHNVVPEFISLKGTIRALNTEVEETALNRLNEIVKGLETTYHVSIEIQVKACGPAMLCDENATRLAEDALNDYFGRDAVCRIDKPSLGFDDFSFFTNLFPATYFRLGSYDPEKGYTYPLHTSRFDFDESLLVSGVEAASAVLVKALNNKNKS